MHYTMLKSKLHRVTVTHSELDYEGSCAIDSALMRLADIHEFEQIQIYNINNGERLTTYAICAEPNSGIISVNGAAAHKASPKDLIIICSYISLDQSEMKTYQPKLIYVDSLNKMTHCSAKVPIQMVS